MSTHPEGGGLFGFFKRLLHIEGGAKTAKKVETAQQQGPQVKKEDAKEKAVLVLQELDRITPGHKAFELLNGIKFEKTTLATNDSLANELLNIINVSDPTVYHDRDWLLKKRDNLEQIKNSATIIGQEKDKIDILIGSRITPLLQKIDTNLRKAELEREFERARWLPQDEIQKQRELAPPAVDIKPDDVEKFKKEWKKEIQEFTPDQNIPEELKVKVKELKRAESKISDPYSSSRDLTDSYGQLFQTFENIKADTKRYMSLNPKDNAGLKEFYEQAMEMYTKTAGQMIRERPAQQGRFYWQVTQNPLKDAIVQRIKTDANYRDYWFYKILEPVIFNQGFEPHRELYNLYVAGDMDAFLEIVRTVRDDTGGAIGRRIADRYNILRNTIFQSHDMDLYAAHPGQDFKEFMGSTSLFLNKYVDAAHQDPLVSLSKRMYERALLNIRETNGGYIPREWLLWEEGKSRASKLDEMVYGMVEQAINTGQLFDIRKDPMNNLPAPSVWGRKIYDPNRPITRKEFFNYESDMSEGEGQELGQLKISAALKQAKGLALVDMRLLEIISQSRPTGSSFEYWRSLGYNKSDIGDQKWNAYSSQFNSLPYEGIVRHIEPVLHYYTRFGVGSEYYDAFFNMMVTQFPDWDPENMLKIVDFHLHGDEVGLQEYLKKKGITDARATRIIESENFTKFSGVWGPETGWRIGDSTIGFDDWERDQTYATAVKLWLIGDVKDAKEGHETVGARIKSGWALEKVKAHFTKDLIRELRSEYRSALLYSNDIRLREAAARDQALIGSGGFDDEFEYVWRTNGIYQKRPGSVNKKNNQQMSYKEIIDKEFEDKYLGETHSGYAYINHVDGADKLYQNLVKAYKARAWMKAAMKAPLVIAREADTHWNLHGYERKTALRNKIIYEILGIDLDEIAAMRTPTAREEMGFDRVTELEGMVGAISERAIRENRDLRPQDFDDALNFMDTSKFTPEQAKKLVDNARMYWDKSKSAVLGEYKSAEQFYQAIGIEDPDGSKNRRQGVRDYKVNLDKTQHIDATVSGLKSKVLNDRLLKRSYKRLFSTEDMGWEYLNINALGERNPVRRAGDLAAHVQFGQQMSKFINDNLVAKPKVDDFKVAFKEMSNALSDDFYDVAADAVAHVAYATSMMYKKSDWAWKIPFVGPIGAIFKETSIMQKIRGRDRADAWGANDMLHFNQAVGGLQPYPKKRKSGFGGRVIAPGSEWDGGKMSKLNGGNKHNATLEIINMTLLVMFALTIWRALTAKSEEDK